MLVPGGTRVVEMDGSFFPGYRKTVLKPEEILLSIEIPYTKKVKHASIKASYLSIHLSTRRNTRMSLPSLTTCVTLTLVFPQSLK